MFWERFEKRLLPWDNAERFQANLEAYTGGRLANWTAWIAPATLNPTDAAKRVGMAESELRSVNQIPANMLIKAGSTLLVRRSVGLDVDVSVHVADNGHLSLAPDVVLKKTTVKAGKKDTVASLAQRFKVSAQSVSDWNKISASAALKPGQALVLYLPVRVTAARAAVAKTGKPAATKATAHVIPKAAPLKKTTQLARK
jgi:membrane-bound lytic murein transglycosylase D